MSTNCRKAQAKHPGFSVLLIQIISSALHCSPQLTSDDIHPPPPFNRFAFQRQLQRSRVASWPKFQPQNTETGLKIHVSWPDKEGAEKCQFFIVVVFILSLKALIQYKLQIFIFLGAQVQFCGQAGQKFLIIVGKSVHARPGLFAGTPWVRHKPGIPSSSTNSLNSKSSYVSQLLRGLKSTQAWGSPCSISCLSSYFTYCKNQPPPPFPCPSFLVFSRFLLTQITCSGNQQTDTYFFFLNIFWWRYATLFTFIFLSYNTLQNMVGSHHTIYDEAQAG